MKGTKCYPSNKNNKTWNPNCHTHRTKQSNYNNTEQSNQRTLKTLWNNISSCQYQTSFEFIILLRSLNWTNHYNRNYLAKKIQIGRKTEHPKPWILIAVDKCCTWKTLSRNFLASKLGDAKGYMVHHIINHCQNPMK